MSASGPGRIARDVLKRFRADWRPYLVLHLVYTGIGIVLLAPLTGAMVRLVVGLSGKQALADQDILGFVLTLHGLVSMVLLGAVLISILALEQVSLMSVAVASGRGGDASIRAALVLPLHRLGDILSFALRLVVRLLLLIGPFLAVGAAVTWFLLSDHDINYYLSERPPVFIAAVVIDIALLLAMALVLVPRLIGWVLALPLVLFNRQMPGAAFGESEKLLSGIRPRIFAVFVIWSLVVLILGTLLAGTVQLIGVAIVPQFSHSLRVLVVVIGGLFALWSLGSYLVTAFSFATFALVVVTAYRKFGPGIDEAAPAAEEAGAGPGAWRFSLTGFVVVLIVSVVGASLTGAWLLSGVRVDDRVAVIAHRGAAGKAPENTLASVRQAIEDGTDWVEIDVQETVDGEVVVVHDSDFMKLAGVPLNVWDATLEQVRGIDVGSSFDPRFAGEHPPTLREVLETARGKARVVIELKYYGYDERLEQRVVDIVESTGMIHDVAIMSLHQPGVEKIRRLRPDWMAGFLAARALGDLARLDVDFLAVNTGMATVRFIHAAQAEGRDVWVWTVNDPVSMSRMISLGVDGIITDEPEMARNVLRDREQMSTAERLLVHVSVLFGKPVATRSYRDVSP